VAIVHRSESVLRGFDADLTAHLVERYRALGIDVVTDAPVFEVKHTAEGMQVTTAGGRVLEADLAVHGAGRVPDLDSVHLRVGGVESTRKGVTVDRHLRSTSNPHVWAAGDAAEPGLPLTPVASRQGSIVAANILGGEEVFDVDVVPTTVFSDPPLSSVGVSTAVAAEDPELEVVSTDMDQWFTQSRVGNDTAAAKIVKERSTGRIVGAHLLGANAEEMINVFAVVIRTGMTDVQLDDVLWSYPTAGSDISYLTGA
jgi:glutathione reductase (NADPH)